MDVAEVPTEMEFAPRLATATLVRVDVEFVPVTFTKPAKVEVAVVEVAVM